MATNLSKYHGIPTTIESAKKQYDEIIRKNKGRPFYRGRYLVLKKLKSGQYKGNYSVFIYETKPTKRYIRARKLG
jgi:hypothetical protein